MIEAALLCLALNVWHEARGEPVEGQFAVALVTMNRAEWSAKNVCTEVYKFAQFSWTLDEDKKNFRPHKSDPSWRKAIDVATLTLKGRMKDITYGATHYHALYVKPEWARKFYVVTTIGQHRFYRTWV